MRTFPLAMVSLCWLACGGPLDRAATDPLMSAAFTGPAAPTGAVSLAATRAEDGEVRVTISNGRLSHVEYNLECGLFLRLENGEWVSTGVPGFCRLYAIRLSPLTEHMHVVPVELEPGVYRLRTSVNLGVEGGVSQFETLESDPFEL